MSYEILQQQQRLLTYLWGHKRNGAEANPDLRQCKRISCVPHAFSKSNLKNEHAEIRLLPWVLWMSIQKKKETVAYA